MARPQDPLNPVGRYVRRGLSIGMVNGTRKAIMLKHTRLKQVLHYDPQTGAFIWVKGRNKGKEAGATHDARGYRKVWIDGKRYYLHVLAWFWMKGFFSPTVIKHVDGDRSNNRWSNLRRGFRSLKGKTAPPVAVMTSYQGVFEVDGANEAVIETSAGAVHIGRFASAEEAAVARHETILRGERQARARERRAA